MDDRNTENRKPDEWMTESGGFSEAEETTATGGKRGKAGRTSSGRKISTRPLLVGCMLFLGIAAAGGCWLIYRTGGKTAGAAAEMNMDVGGRITDRLDDVDSSLEENTKLLKDTADFVDSSNAKYDEIKSSLQAIRDQLTEYQSIIGEDGGTGEAAENSGLSTVEVGGAESAEIAYETGRDSEERDVSASIASILAKTEEALQKIEDSRRESSEKKMETIATQREFEALEKEIKDASASEEELLKQVRAKEQESKELDAQCEAKSAELKAQQEQVDTESAKIESVTSEKQARLADLEAKCRSYIDDKINEELYEKFCTIVKSKHGKGIVPIHGVVCQGCHIVLPIQFVNDVRSGENIEFCPYCSRILYYEEVEGAEEQFTSVEKEDVEDDEQNSEGSGLSEFADEGEFDDIV